MPQTFDSPSPSDPDAAPDPTHETSATAGLLEAVSRAFKVVSGEDDGAALRTSFQVLARGLRVQRAFLARVSERGRLGEVLVAQGLDSAQLAALRSGESSPGVSPSLLRAAIASGQPQFVPDTRLRLRGLELTGSLTSGGYSVICQSLRDPHTRMPLAVLYLQTSSLVAPLTAALLQHVGTYAAVLAHACHAWARPRPTPHDARTSRPLPPELDILGDSEATAALREHLQRIVIPAMAAARPDPILILGPTGAGKDLVARYLHAASSRSKGRFVALNCGAFAGDVLESTLFGHVRGAFTGAVNASEGMFVAADHGVLFLDELGNMPVQGQMLLLRALESRTVRPVGGRDERPVNVQLIAATNADLAAEVQAGRFRQDLYHRLRGLIVRLTPLSERPADIPPLLCHYLRLHEERLGKRTQGLAPELTLLLMGYAWSGNVRELSSVCSQLVMHADPQVPIDARVLARAVPEVGAALGNATTVLEVAHAVSAMSGALFPALEAFERAYLIKAGERFRWRRAPMARYLALDRKGLYARLRRHGLMDMPQAGGHAQLDPQR